VNRKFTSGNLSFKTVNFIALLIFMDFIFLCSFLTLYIGVLATVTQRLRLCGNTMILTLS
jgi:hypothetical protein